MSQQSERSKRWLEEALLQLMRQKHFSEITITDITARRIYGSGAEKRICSQIAVPFA